MSNPLKDNPFVSIVTLNWNGTDVTCEFLESTKSFTYKNYEIIVVDNGSKEDPTERILAGNYPNVKIVKSPVPRFCRRQQFWYASYVAALRFLLPGK